MTGRITFGEYEGTKFDEIPASYLVWLYEEGVDELQHPELAKYLVENIDWLEREVEQNQKMGFK